MIGNLVKFAVVFILLQNVFGQDVPQCLRCNSLDNSFCINPEGIMGSQPCSKPSNFSCFSRVLENGNVQRGCLSELPASEQTACNAPLCSICHGINQSGNGSNCNVGLFPQHRLTCVICHDNGTCTGNTDLPPQFCSRHVESDRCYVRKLENSTVERGCLSSISGSCDEANCWACDGHGCNNKDERGSSATVTVNFLLLVAGIIAILFSANK